VRASGCQNLTTGDDWLNLQDFPGMGGPHAGPTVNSEVVSDSIELTATVCICEEAM